MGEEGGHVDEVACSSTAEQGKELVGGELLLGENRAGFRLLKREAACVPCKVDPGRIRFGGDDQSCETVGYLNPLHVESFLDEQCLQLR